MSTKTTFKRIALVTVAALGFGFISVMPSQATVTGTTITVNQNGTAATAAADTTTAAIFTVSGLVDNSEDTITVGFVLKSKPALGTDTARLTYIDTATSSSSLVSKTIGAYTAATKLSLTESQTAGVTEAFGVRSATASYVGAKFGIQLESATATTLTAGTYTYTVIVKSYSAGTATPVTQTADVSVVVAAAAVAVPAAANAKAILEAGNPTNVTSVVDSVTTGSYEAGTTIGKIKVSNFSATNVAASDTITVSMSGVGYLTDGTTTGRSFVIASTTSAVLTIKADGTSGEGKITITTAAGASFVKTVTFFDTKPSKVVAKVEKAFIKAGTAEVTDVFSVVVTDVLGNAVTNASITAAPTDTATVVGGAASCGTYDTTDGVYYCAVKGLSATKFGPVAYTIKATGIDTAKTVLSTSASVTFADSVATKAVLTGPAAGTPGATVEYTLTLTEKNGYPVADQTYGVGSEGGVLFAKSVVSGWSTAPFATTDSFTSTSGVITSKGILPIAGVATGTWTLVGDGLQTLAANAIDKTIGKTTLTVTTDVANPGVDAATDAANEATDAANAATDAALAAAEAADAATTAAQEASDAVAALSESVTKLIAGLQAQIKSLAAVVAKIAKKVKA